MYGYFCRFRKRLTHALPLVSAMVAGSLMASTGYADSTAKVTLSPQFTKGQTKYSDEIQAFPEEKDNAKFQLKQFSKMDLTNIYSDARLASKKNKPVFTVFDQDPRSDAPNKLRLTYLNIQQALNSMIYGDDLDKKKVHLASASKGGNPIDKVTGTGTSVAVIDSGINTRHGHFDNKVQVKDLGGQKYANEVTHGTEVALTTGGSGKGSKFTGVAPGSKIQAYAIDPENVVLEDVFYEVYRDKVSVANASFVLGDDTSFFPSIRDTFYKIFKDPNAPLYVFAAGNKDDEGSTFSPLLKRLVEDDKILKNTLVVSGVKARNAGVNLQNAKASDIVFDSDAISCRFVKYNCLAAFFEYDIPDPKAKGSTNRLVTAYGTSFSAPQVSGAAVLVKQMFPWFTADMIRQSLLTTATDIGAPGIDEQTGWGLLNIGAAVYGPAQFAFGDFVADLSLDKVSKNRAVFFFRNNIHGQYGLVVRDSNSSNRKLVLTGENTYKGTTTVQSGFLRLGGLGKAASVTSPINIEVEGTFQLSAESKTGNVYNNGFFISVSDTPGKGGLVNGTFTNTSGGYMFLKAGNPLRVNGEAKLSGALVVHLPENLKPEPGKAYVLLKANKLTGEFLEFKVEDDKNRYPNSELFYNKSTGEVAVKFL